MTMYTRTTGNEGQTSEQKRPPLKWIVNFPNEKLSKLERPCFVAACYGNEKMATLLNYFIYEASREAEKLKVNLESCSDIVLELSQDEILEKLKYASKKTLIGHLDKFNEWGYVGSRKYGRTYTVHFKAVQHAIDNPPAKEDKKGRTSQSCRTTTSRKRQHSKVVDDEMLYQLQQNVVELQLKVVELQQKVVNLQLSQSHEVAPPLAPYTIYDAYRLLDCNRLIETIDNKRESSEKHTIVSSDTAHALPSKTEEFLEKLREWRIEDEQALPSQDEEMFRNDEPQGDTHATAASGHPHRVGDTATADVDNQHGIEQSKRLVAPETGPVLEAGQEIDDKGDTHATRVPTVPRADHPASLERDAAGHPQSDNHCASLPADVPAVVHPVGRGTPGPQGSQDGKDTSPLTPAQSLPLPQDAQAASGAKQEPKPLSEPDMSGKWSHEKCVEYAEWCNQKRYTEKMHEEQLKAAHAIHKNDVVLTLEQFKQAYDERNDAWWKEHKGKLHVNDMKARGASGIDRVHEMLQRIEDTASRSRVQTPRVLVPAPSPNQPITNIRELVRQREALRAATAATVGV